MEFERVHFASLKSKTVGDRSSKAEPRNGNAATWRRLESLIVIRMPRRYRPVKFESIRFHCTRGQMQVY